MEDRPLPIQVMRAFHGVSAALLKNLLSTGPNTLKNEQVLKYLWYPSNQKALGERMCHAGYTVDGERLPQPPRYVATTTLVALRSHLAQLAMSNE